MTAAVWFSAFVAAVFAVHPLRAESVAWVSERKDVLSGMFFMLTLAAYIRYARNAWSLKGYLPVPILFAFGLMSKPMLVTLPVILILLDYWPLKRFPYLIFYVELADRTEIWRVLHAGSDLAERWSEPNLDALP